MQARPSGGRRGLGRGRPGAETGSREGQAGQARRGVSGRSRRASTLVVPFWRAKAFRELRRWKRRLVGSGGGSPLPGEGGAFVWARPGKRPEPAHASLLLAASPSRPVPLVPSPEVPRGRPGGMPWGRRLGSQAASGYDGGRDWAWAPAPAQRVVRAGAQAPWENNPGVTAPRCLMGEALEALRSDQEIVAACRDWEDAGWELTLQQHSPLRPFFFSWVS